MRYKTLAGLMVAVVLAGCSVQQTPAPATPTAAASATPEPTPTAGVTLTPTLTPAPTETIEPEAAVCSPLTGYALPDLAGMIVNPYHPPRLGSDDPHQGVDLAIVDPTLGFAVPGNPVQAVLAGKVAGVALDRFPYGNLVMIESPLEGALPGALPLLALPTPLPERLPRGALTCPELTVSPPAAGAPRSLYILYGHMLNPPGVQIGDSVGCGQEIGIVGQSGNALNPHVHVEVRVGPPGQVFPSMAHYDPSASYDEMAAYCTWRVSGVYQTIDPGCLWGDCPTP